MTVSVMYSSVVYIVHYVEKQNLKDFQMDSLVIDNNTDTLTTQLDGSNPLQLKWKYPEGKGIYFPFLDLPLINLSSSYSITDLHVGKDYLYAMQGGDFIIIDKQSGKRVDSIVLFNGKRNAEGNVVFHNGIIYFGVVVLEELGEEYDAIYHVMAYDLQSRDFLWKRIEKREWVGFNLGITLSVENDMVVATLVGAFDQPNVLGLSGNDGQKKWEVSLKELPSIPANIIDNTVIVSTHDKENDTGVGVMTEIVGIDGETGTVVWKTQVTGTSVGYHPWSVINGMLYAGLRHRKDYIVKIDPHTGGIIWRTDLSDFILSPISIYDNALWLSGWKTIFKLNEETGTIVATQDMNTGGEFPLVFTKNEIILVSYWGYVKAIPLKGGQTLWKEEITDKYERSYLYLSTGHIADTSADESTVYITTHDGMIFALESKK
jgi:outer membrane protein assembly factor BamB